MTKYIILLFLFRVYICNAQKLSSSSLNYLKSISDTILDNPAEIFNVGRKDLYMGNNERGNEIMNYAINISTYKNENIYHAFSTQNTKNGNYAVAIDALNMAVKYDINEAGYYGWVLLYYYRDYKNAIKYLTIYDSITPNTTDYPGGESLNSLLGIAYLQLGDFEKSVQQFDVYINEISNNFSLGEKWIDPYILIYKGIALTKLQKNEEAILLFDKALVRYNKSPEATYYKALSLIALNRNEEVCNNLNQSLQNYSNKKSDIYIELPFEIYNKDIELNITKYCKY